MGANVRCALYYWKRTHAVLAMKRTFYVVHITSHPYPSIHKNQYASAWSFPSQARIASGQKTNYMALGRKRGFKIQRKNMDWYSEKLCADVFDIRVGRRLDVKNGRTRSCIQLSGAMLWSASLDIFCKRSVLKELSDVWQRLSDPYIFFSLVNII